MAVFILDSHIAAGALQRLGWNAYGAGVRNAHAAPGHGRLAMGANPSTAPRISGFRWARRHHRAPIQVPVPCQSPVPRPGPGGCSPPSLRRAPAMPGAMAPWPSTEILMGWRSAGGSTQIPHAHNDLTMMRTNASCMANSRFELPPAIDTHRKDRFSILTVMV